MQQYGADLSAHRSRMLTGEMLHAADVVLVMTRHQQEAICAEFPAESAKVFLLSQLIGQRFDIDDPISGPEEDYRRCADDIQHILRTGYARLAELAKRADDPTK
jgi:protein-tyrosine-phosphatase